MIVVEYAKLYYYSTWYRLHVPLGAFGLWHKHLTELSYQACGLHLVFLSSESHQRYENRKALSHSCLAYLKLSWEDSARVDVTGVGLNGFIIAQDLSSRSSWHGRKEKAVSDTVSSNNSQELESFNQVRQDRKDLRIVQFIYCLRRARRASIRNSQVTWSEISLSQGNLQTLRLPTVKKGKLH